MVLSMLFQVPNGDVVIGAGVPLNTLFKVLDEQANVVSGYKVLADHVRKVNLTQFKKTRFKYHDITIPLIRDYINNVQKE